ncbi:hypothetical protein [Clostridium sp.]|uniref:anti-sigma-I factor RsgI family protein n=1 Tax=Clostridium sp. TaxID=1506 RepID=UPI0034649D74
MKILSLYENKYSFSYKNKIHVINKDIDEIRKKEVYFFHKELKIYGFNIRDLSSDKPTLTTRNELLNIAFFIKNNESFLSFVENKRTLPINKLSLETGQTPLFISKWQGYITAYLIIINNKRYHNIRNYLSTNEYEESHENVNYEMKENNITGLNLLVNKNNSCSILTSYGIFLNITPHNPCEVGEIITGKKAKGFKHLIKLGSLALIILFLAYGVYTFTYNTPKSTLVLDIGTTITMNVNKFNKIIDIHASSSSGRKLLESTDLENSNLDEGLSSLINSSIQNKVINDNKKISIFVTTNELDFDSLTKTKEVIINNKLDSRINNNGSDYFVK